MPERPIDDLMDRWLTVHEAAAYLGVSVKTLAKWRNNNSGPPYSCALGRDPRYLLSSLHRFMSDAVVTNTTLAHHDRTRRREERALSYA